MTKTVVRAKFLAGEKAKTIVFALSDRWNRAQTVDFAQLSQIRGFYNFAGDALLL